MLEPAVRSGSSAAGVSHEFVNNLQTQLRESVAQMEGLEKERDFYFAKVRHGEVTSVGHADNDTLTDVVSYHCSCGTSKSLSRISLNCWRAKARTSKR